MKQAQKLDRNLRYLVAVARRANEPWPWRACKSTVGKTGGRPQQQRREEEKQRCSQNMLAARLRALPLPHTPLLACPVECVCCVAVWCVRVAG